MVHKRYVKKNGRIHGPYYYESYREDGVVKKRYIGSGKKKLFDFKYLILGVVLLSFLVFIFGNLNIRDELSGRIVLEPELEHEEGELLKGNLRFVLKPGEFIPADSIVRVKMGEQTSEILLSGALNREPTQGEFYIDGIGYITGEGRGYGVAGKKEVTPNVNFKLFINKLDIADSSIGTEQDIARVSDRCKDAENITLCELYEPFEGNESLIITGKEELLIGMIPSKGVPTNEFRITLFSSAFAQDVDRVIFGGRGFSFGTDKKNPRNLFVSVPNDVLPGKYAVVVYLKDGRTSLPRIYEVLDYIGTGGTGGTGGTVGCTLGVLQITHGTYSCISGEVKYCNNGIMEHYRYCGSLSSPTYNESTQCGGFGGFGPINQPSGNSGMCLDQDDLDDLSFESFEYEFEELELNKVLVEKSFVEKSSLEKIKYRIYLSLGSIFNSIISIKGYITGLIVTEDEKIVDGNVKFGENYVYALGTDESAKIVDGSVNVGGELIGKSFLDLRVLDRNAIVTTSYHLEEEGFGKDYLGDYNIVLNIELEKFNLVAEGDNVEVSLVYDERKFASVNVNLSEEENLLEESSLKKEKLVQIKEFDDIKVLKNGVVEIDLKEYFTGAEEYSISFDGIEAIFNGDLIILTPKEDFSGVRRGKVIAFANDERIEGNEFDILVSSGTISVRTDRAIIKVGEKVKWRKDISLELAENIRIELPSQAENVIVKKIENGIESEINVEVNRKELNVESVALSPKEEDILNRIFKGITGNVVRDVEKENSIEVIIEDDAKDYVIEYETEAPQVIEEEKEHGKRVVISGPSELDYRDVVSFVNVPEILSIEQEGILEVVWLEGDENINFNVGDLNSNGLIDYVEWITGHLSSQTFDIVLTSEAEELNEDRYPIRDVYSKIKEADNNWAVIEGGNYLRVRFERALENNDKIEIIARSNSQNTRVELYQEEFGSRLNDFGFINENRTYEVSLSSLSEKQDVFDLKVVGNDSVEFDFVFDPTGQAPGIEYIAPTPIDGAVQPGSSIFVKTKAEHIGEHYTLVDFDNDLRLWLTMDEFSFGLKKVYDLSNGNDGSLVGDSFVIDSGKFGKGVSFIDGGIEVPETESLELKDEFSVSFWFNKRENVCFEEGVLGKWDSSSKKGANEWAFGLCDRVRFMIEDDSFNLEEVSIGELLLDRWYHVVGVKDKDKIKLYINGNLAGISDYTGGVNDANVKLFIGGYDGIVDELLIFSRALNEGEIKSLYSSSKNQYENNFEQLSFGEHGFEAFVIADDGDMTSAGKRRAFLDGNLTISIESLDGSNKTNSDLRCFDVLSSESSKRFDVEVAWYRNGELNLSKTYKEFNGGIFEAILGSDNTRKGESWSCGIRLYDGKYTNWERSANLIIKNTAPSIELLSPEDGINTTDRELSFSWLGSDLDNDNMTYELNISLMAKSLCDDKDRYIVGLNDSNYKLKDNLRCFYDDLDHYSWEVRAFDGEEYGNWSLGRKLNINSYVDVVLVESSLEFPALGQLQSDNTTDNKPRPFILQNNGNSFADVKVYGDSLWDSVNNPSEYYKIKADIAEEKEPFDLFKSVIDWINVPGEPTELIHSLNWSDESDSAEVDVYIQVPPGEGAGDKSSTITFVSSLGE